MLNLHVMLRAPVMRKYEATLKRKSCLNDNQSSRQKRETVIAHDEAMAREVVLMRRENQAFVVAKIKEIR
jgi:hypothetical protein